jgi:Capsular polysaccharide biosynthesis protein
MIPTEFSGRKLRRKLAADGPVETVRAAGDLVTRKRLGRPVFDSLVKRDVVRTLPRNELRRRAKTVDVPNSASPKPFSSLITNGIVLTETGLVLTEAFEILEESAAGPEQAQQAMMAMLSRELFYGMLPLRGLLFGSWDTESLNPDSGPIAPLIPRYPDNYYHWMVETVPKIRYLRAFETEQEPVTLLISADAPPFVDETLDLLGWPDSRVVRANHDIYRVTELVVPSFPDRRPADFKWLREEILESAPDHIPESGNNVYVSRSNGVERRVVNEDEVMDVLSKFGFERYLLEERSLAENARLFADADVIVGPHGAGLTDIVFAGDATLIELFGEKVKQPYKLLAEAVGVDYETMYCTPESTDIVVDVEELDERVARALEE